MRRSQESRVGRSVIALFLAIGLCRSAWASEGGTEPAVVAVPMWQVTAIPDGLTLAECYALALKRSETIAIRREQIREAEARFLQALSTALPRVSFQSSDKWQDGTGDSAYIPERKFFFSQPLFSGFKEFAALSGSGAERRQRRDERTRAEQLLLVDVANAFYLVLEQREDLQALETERLALMERVGELTERERLGRSRRSEVASAQAQLRRVEAEQEHIASQAMAARELLQFLTGLTALTSLEDPEQLVAEPGDQEGRLAKGASRPDVQATGEAWRVAVRQVRIAQSALWPTVSVEGDYYTERVGVSDDINWDALLKVDVPLFQGGQAVGGIREASAKAREAKLQYQEAERRAVLEIRNAFTQFQAAMARSEALEQALRAAEESYRLQVEDYQHNLVNNLEVLQALQALVDARRDAVHGHYEAKRLYWQLRVASGETL